LHTILTIDGKEDTVLAHLNALKPGESNSIELLGFLLDIGRGCFRDDEERISRVFLAMLEKIDLFPQMLLNFFSQKDGMLLTGIIDFSRSRIAANRPSRVDVMTPQFVDEQIKTMRAKIYLLFLLLLIWIPQTRRW
jgi:hypothetical protein